MLAKRPAFENKCFNYLQWSRGSKQPFWKQLFTSQHGEACPLCGEDKEADQQGVHRGSVQPSCYSEEHLSLSLFSPWGETTLLCASALPESPCPSPDQLPMEPYETAEEDSKQKLLKVIEKRQQQTTLKIKEWKEWGANCAERLTTDTFSWKQWQPILSPGLEAQVGFLFHIRAPGS